MSAIDHARELLRQGFAPIPVPYRSKRPALDGWQSLALTEAELERYFDGNPQNVGALMGEPSGGRVDIDLDCAEARALAPRFLPSTRTFGRASSQRSHWEYQGVPTPRTRKFQDPGAERSDGEAMLVELRSTGAQTIMPGSVHESGEPIAWDSDVPIETVDGDELTEAAARLAAACLLARHWPGAGARHDAALALAGGLRAARWGEQEATRFVEAVATVGADDEVPDRVRCVATTYASGNPSSQWAKLASLLGGRVVRRVQQWLHALELLPEADRQSGGPEVAAEFIAGANIGAGDPMRQPGDDSDERPAKPAPNPPVTPGEVLLQMQAGGPLVRVPTGIAPLDALCRGGFPIPWRVFFVGAPTAGKTAIEVIAADAMSRDEDGLCVGLLGVDEEPEDLTIRLMVMAGYSIEEAELRDPEVMRRALEDLAPLRVRLYDSTWTIEAAAADLAAWSKAEGRPAMLGLDSLQTVRCEASSGKDSPREHVEANVRAIRKVSTELRILVVATVEANRGSYRTEDAADTTNDLAAGAESRAIEFGAQTMLMLRTPKGYPGVIHVRVAKNRRADTGEFWLQLDKARHGVREVPDPSACPEQVAEQEQKARKANRAKVDHDAAELAKVLGRHPEGLSERGLRAAVLGAGHRWGVSRLDAAKSVLADGCKGFRLVDRTPKPEKERTWALQATEA